MHAKRSGHPHEGRDERSERGDEKHRADDPLDPDVRRAAHLAPPIAITPEPLRTTSPADTMAPAARVSLEELLPQLVKRIAWAGDRRKGSVQLEIGSGVHAGTTVTVHADEGRVRVELDGANVDGLREAVAARLRMRGIQLESVT